MNLNLTAAEACILDWALFHQICRLEAVENKSPAYIRKLKAANDLMLKIWEIIDAHDKARQN